MERLWAPASDPEENVSPSPRIHVDNFIVKVLVLNLQGDDCVETKHGLLEKPLT